MADENNHEKANGSSAAVAPSMAVLPEKERQYPSGAQLVLIIGSIYLATFLVALDQTIIAPALGAITAQFRSVHDIGWYGSAYLLTTTALQPSYGKVYRTFNIKHTFLVAAFVFELGSLVCATAPTSAAFIVGRAVAGLGTAGLFSGAVIILAHALPLHRRPMAFGLIGGIWGIASVAGPLLGGVFTDHATWRWCFYVNLPIGGVAMTCVVCFLEIRRNDALPTASTGAAAAATASLWTRVQDLDLPGAAVLITAVICLIMALQWGGTEYAWNDGRIIGLFVGFGLLLLLFSAIQIYRGDRGTLPPRLFKNRDVLAAMVFSFFFGAAFFPLVYYLSLYFQAINGDSAVQAGIKLLPLLISTVLMSVVSGGLASFVGYYNLFILPCMVLFTVGAGMLTTLAVDTPLPQWFGYQVIAGLGIGAGFQVGVLTVQNVLPFEWVPVGTACVQFMQSLGGATFIAVAQSVFQNGLIEGIRDADPSIGIPPELFINSGVSQVRDLLASLHASQYLDVVLKAYLQGLRNAYYITVGCAAAAFVAACCLRWKKLAVAGEGAMGGGL